MKNGKLNISFIITIVVLLWMFIIFVAIYMAVDPPAAVIPIAVTPIIVKSEPPKEQFSLDSTLYYFKRQMDYSIDYKTAAAKYYAYEKEKYRLQANRCRDSSHKYFLLLQAYSKKFK